MSNKYAWKTATPRERADAIRMHVETVGVDLTKILFNLSEDGLNKIRAGDNWRYEYSVVAPPHGRANDAPHGQ